MWNESSKLFFNAKGNSASTISESGDETITVETIDNIVNGEEVSLIKMDIEGAELRALQGATETIKKWKPTLAVCTYHKPEDLIILPWFIKSINDNYRFYLRHHDITLDELVLYAVPE